MAMDQKNLKEEISELLSINDPVVTDFVLNIHENCKNIEEFIQKINELEVGISRPVIEQIDTCIKGYSNLSAKDRIALIFQRELSLTDPVVVDFVIDLFSKCKGLEDFQTKLAELETGLTSDKIQEIYSILFSGTDSRKTIKKEESSTAEETLFSGLSLPNRKITWNDLAEKQGARSLKKELHNHIPYEELDPAPMLHKIYPGKVKNIAPFGCFVHILGTQDSHCDGLVHVSEIADYRISAPEEVVSPGQRVFVKVVRIQNNGKISLSMKSVDQLTGKEILAERGRSDMLDKKLPRRKLTSPERWEIRQLIASGVASADDYPELQEEIEQEQEVSKSKRSNREVAGDHTGENQEIDVELNTEDEPQFLAGQVQKAKKYDMPKITKVPKGSMNRTAINGSQMMKEHREEKFKKKKEMEQEFRRKTNLEDPTLRDEQKTEDERFTKRQLALTAWERNRMREQVTYGKRTDLPIKQQRESLPVFQMRQKLIDAVDNNQFLVIVGETGSGKTTQITQYLHEEGFGRNGIIGCTQPRRVAAISVAKRVAEEMGCTVGEEVGYTIRFEDETSPMTKIKYMTDGMLQREALLDSKMSKYSVILLDEAHERTVATDVLFALLKKAALQRPDLKVIVTSATLDSEKFSKYFMECPVIRIPGRTFPVEVLYAQTPQMDYIESALDTVMEIHINEGSGDILVFLTGQEEIDTCCELLYERVKTLGDTIQDLLILPVYSALPSEIQSKIFEPTPKGSRKVIFATNIAETSITIDGIYYVVDPGFSKINTYNPKVGMEQLVVSPISQAQANQRKGRAGRTGPGKCYRLYTESAFYNEMLPATVPEIQRQNLSHTILMLKAMGVNDLLHFDFMDPPPKSSMVGALQQLFNLQALDEDGYLTKLGKRMSQFPMEPALSKTLLASFSNDCSEEVLTIISMLSVQNVFYRPKDKQQEADNKKARFHHPYGDHLTLLNIYRRWEESHYSKHFCTNNYLHERHLKRARDVKIQLTNIFKKLNLRITSCGADVDKVRKTLVSGFFRNAAKRDSHLGYKTVSDGTAVSIHPSSSLFGKEYEYVIYHSLVLTTREYMSQVTTIDPMWLIESAPHYYKVAGADSESRKKAKIVPLHNKFAKDQDSWRLSSIRQSKERALGIKR